MRVGESLPAPVRTAPFHAHQCRELLLLLCRELPLHQCRELLLLCRELLLLCRELLLRQATTLGCGHTFCAVCLAETRDRGDDRCPLCRVTITSAIRSVTLNSIVRSVITAAAAEGRW
ncbi:E3 ubiquitin-protein ligase rnf8 [Amphibalanus amphitrite]|uniref:E3 ubiquitin-protein ligase rnf8 n=1 Tax=Amphibalanus amphitrite TaxID=1232801 RepID=A0A6A4V7K7_AMPAM|nr:E3 ubiquitin-protein ligase rnf8 [Amphibalanus amphitrite]